MRNKCNIVRNILAVLLGYNKKFLNRLCVSKKIRVMFFFKMRYSNNHHTSLVPTMTMFRNRSTYFMLKKISSSGAATYSCVKRNPYVATANPHWVRFVDCCPHIFTPCQKSLYISLFKQANLGSDICSLMYSTAKDRPQNKIINIL